MSKYRVPDEQEQRIIRENGMKPEQFSVEFRSKDSIYLLNFKTRDTVAIHKGDRAWS